MRSVAVALACFVAGFVVAQALKFPQPQVQPVKAVVTRVIDGDTFEARIGNETKPVTVRVIGYDAPEKDQPFGDTATKFLKSFLEGREVLLEPDVQALDKYGRRLYHVWVPNVLVSELMLLVGLGQQMTIPPNVRHVDFLTRARNSGREIKLGIWSVTVPVPKTEIIPRVSPQSRIQTGTDVVYITRTGKKFHRAGCRYLRYSAIPIKRADAIAQGYEPCSVCLP